MRRADVEIGAGLLEGYLLRVALAQSAGVPIADLAFVEGRRRVRDVAGIREGHGRSRLDPGAGREIGVFAVVVADPDLVVAIGDRASRPGHSLRRWRRPQRTELTLERERPYRIAGGAALDRIAAGDNRDVLVAIDFISHCRRVGAKPGLELPQHLAGLGVDCDEIAVGL